jgi:hypothetical protein
VSGSEANASNLISVKTELVHEFVVGRILDEVKQRNGQPLSAGVETSLVRVHELAGSGEDEGPPGDDFALTVARAGYLARVIESELFVPARMPSPYLEEKLRDAVIEPAQTESVASAVALELARHEPEERPDPDDPRAVSWQIPGPGGHVRHYVALQTVEWLAEPAQQAGLSEPQRVDLKRCWIYGFFLRCCEEAAAPTT